MELERVEVVPSLPPREAEGHKGTYGRVMVVAGSRALIGAAALTANGALRGGAGLVMVATPQIIQPHVLSLCPCAISLPLACEGGELSADAVRQVREALARNDVAAVGPGLATGVPQQMLLRALLEQDKPLVLDADGLNNLVGIDDWAALRRGPVVLTPHPGEMARLIGRSTKDVQADRQGIAVSAVRDWTDRRTLDGPPLVLLLKGHGTIVTDGRRLYVNATGNPGMATGGVGDVLTGVIAALIAQGLPVFEAAVLGAFVHGLAGDIAAERMGQVSLIATDVLDHLPAAFQRH